MFRDLKAPWASAKQVMVVGAAIAVALAAPAADAMRVSPMVAEMTTSGAGSSARIEVGNVGSAALPFETLITEIKYDDVGGMTEVPADENFLVFPPQGVVPVRGRQVVRVQWVGDPTMPASRAYYLAVRQLPVATEPRTSESGGAVEVKVLYRMKALLVVAPPNAKPEISVESVMPAMVSASTPAIDPSLTGGETPAAAPEQPGLEVVVVNRGSRYALMSGATWIIEGVGDDGAPVRLLLTGDQISSTVGVGYVAPSGGRRTFRVPTGTAFDASRPIKVSFAR